MVITVGDGIVPLVSVTADSPFKLEAKSLTLYADAIFPIDTDKFPAEIAACVAPSSRTVKETAVVVLEYETYKESEVAKVFVGSPIPTGPAAPEPPVIKENSAYNVPSALLNQLEKFVPVMLATSALRVAEAEVVLI